VNAGKRIEDDRMKSGEWRGECQRGNRAQEALAESVTNSYVNRPNQRMWCVLGEVVVRGKSEREEQVKRQALGLAGSAIGCLTSVIGMCVSTAPMLEVCKRDQRKR